MEWRDFREALGWSAAVGGQALPDGDGKIKVLFVVSDRAGCGYYRAFVPAFFLNEYSERVCAVVTEKPRECLVDWADVIVWQRGRHTDMLDVAVAAKERGKRIVYELDDNLHWLDEKNPARAVYKPGTAAFVNTIAWMRMCDQVIVSTENLKVFYDVILDNLDPEHKGKCTVVENMIDCSAFGGVDGRPVFDRVRIVWAGGYSHYDDLRLIAEPLRKIKDDYGRRVKIFMFGYDGVLYRHELENGAEMTLEPGNRIAGCVARKCETAGVPKDDYKPGVDPDLYYGALGRLCGDIGLAPLLANEFNRCKSPLKWMEYSLAGMATVASAVGPYNRAVRNGIDGLLVNGCPEAWYDAIARLVEDEWYRKKLAVNADVAVRGRCDAREKWREWERVMVG